MFGKPQYTPAIQDHKTDHSLSSFLTILLVRFLIIFMLNYLEACLCFELYLMVYVYLNQIIVAKYNVEISSSVTVHGKYLQTISLIILLRFAYVDTEVPPHSILP